MKYRVFTEYGMLVGELDCYNHNLKAHLEKMGYQIKPLNEAPTLQPRVAEAGSIGGQMVKAMIAAYERSR